MIQLADRSVKRPKGEIHDVLVRVGEFIYPVDFIVLETQPVSNSNHRAQTPVILGRPFLATANAIINCRNGSMRLTFGDMTREMNVFNVDKQPRKTRDQTYEVNFVENNCEEERDDSEDELLFLNELFQNECNHLDVEDPNVRVPFQKGKLDLDIFTFKEPTKSVIHKDIINEPPIDILFEDLFKDELMYLDEPTQDILINGTYPGKSVDLSFEEIYEAELEFLGIQNKEVSKEQSGDGGKFFKEHCGDMRMNHLKQLKLETPKAQRTIQLVSQLSPLK